MIRFEWDDEKAESNFRKHGITFEEAVLVFKDPLAKVIKKQIENDEERLQIVGMAKNFFLLLVVHTAREANNVEIIRIISARPVTKHEKRQYEHG
jgi:uncharacterized DUF497 family protein